MYEKSPVDKFKESTNIPVDLFHSQLKFRVLDVTPEILNNLWKTIYSFSTEEFNLHASGEMNKTMSDKLIEGMSDVVVDECICTILENDFEDCFNPRASI